MSERLSLAMVCYPQLGGSGVVAAELAIGLAQRGHRVRIVASTRPKIAMPELENLTFEPVRASDYPLFDHPPYTLDAAAKMVELATGADIDVVHLHYAIPHAASALLASQTLTERRPRFVTTLHGTDVTLLGSDPSYRAVTRHALASCDGITAPSAFLQCEARRLLELREETPIEVIANFVDTDRFKPPQRRDPDRLGELLSRGGAAPRGPFLIHVSNFRPIKRCLELIDILARVREKIAAHLALIGDGPDRAATAQRAGELGLEDDVTFVGESIDFVEMLGHADAFVLPSRSESFGVAALEALSCGVPVFGYRVGGLGEVVASKCGALVDPFDVAALSDAIAATVSDAKLRDRAGHAARERAVRYFEKGEIVGRYESYYRELLSRERG